MQFIPQSAGDYVVHNPNTARPDDLIQHPTGDISIQMTKGGIWPNLPPEAFNVLSFPALAAPPGVATSDVTTTGAHYFLSSLAHTTTKFTNFNNGHFGEQCGQILTSYKDDETKTEFNIERWVKCVLERLGNGSVKIVIATRIGGVAQGLVKFFLPEDYVTFTEDEEKKKTTILQKDVQFLFIYDAAGLDMFVDYVVDDKMDPTSLKDPSFPVENINNVEKKVVYQDVTFHHLISIPHYLTVLQGEDNKTKPIVPVILAHGGEDVNPNAARFNVVAGGKVVQ